MSSCTSSKQIGARPKWKVGACRTLATDGRGVPDWKPLKTPAFKGLCPAERELLEGLLQPRWGADQPREVLAYIDRVWRVAAETEARNAAIASLEAYAYGGLSTEERELTKRVQPRAGTDRPRWVLRYIEHVWHVTEKNAYYRLRREHRFSDYWKQLRAAARKRANGCCERCGVRGENRYGNPDNILSLHHTTYERLGHELLEDVILICARCHDGEHGNSFSQAVR